MALSRVGRCCRSLAHDSVTGGLFRLLPSAWCEARSGAKRHLLSENSLKLQSFQERNLVLPNPFSEVEGNIIELIRVKAEKNELITKHELRQLLHNCKSADDVVIATDAIYRFNAANKQTEYRYGPLYIRLCYELGLLDMAVAAITDKSMKGFFYDATSYNITMDMLFNDGAYEKALEVLNTMRNNNIPSNRDTYTMAAGICYKLNTAESYKICMDLIEDGQSNSNSIGRSAYCFAVALAMRQDEMTKAQTLYSQILNFNNTTCQNLKLMMLVMTGAMGAAISILQKVTLRERPSLVWVPEISQEVVDLLLSESEGGPHMSEVKQIVADLEKAGQVTLRTLDHMLCQVPYEKRRHEKIVEKSHNRSFPKFAHSTLMME